MLTFAEISLRLASLMFMGPVIHQPKKKEKIREKKYKKRTYVGIFPLWRNANTGKHEKNIGN